VKPPVVVVVVDAVGGDLLKCCSRMNRLFFVWLGVASRFQTSSESGDFGSGTERPWKLWQAFRILSIEYLDLMIIAIHKEGILNITLRQFIN